MAMRRAKPPVTVTITKSERPYMLTIEVHGDVPPATNAILGAHWRVKHENAVKWKKIIIPPLAPFLPEKPLEQAQISACRYSHRMVDFDGLVASLKPVIDSLKDAGVIIDDRWSVTGRWNVFQEFRPKKQGQSLVICVSAHCGPGDIACEDTRT